MRGKTRGLVVTHENAVVLPDDDAVVGLLDDGAPAAGLGALRAVPLQTGGWKPGVNLGEKFGCAPCGGCACGSTARSGALPNERWPWSVLERRLKPVSGACALPGAGVGAAPCGEGANGVSCGACDRPGAAPFGWNGTNGVAPGDGCIPGTAENGDGCGAAGGVTTFGCGCTGGV